MPNGAKILHVAEQAGLVCIWAQCDPDAPDVPREIMAYGTGHPMPDHPGRYIGSFMLGGGEFIFHAYEPES